MESHLRVCAEDEGLFILGIELLLLTDRHGHRQACEETGRQTKRKAGRRIGRRANSEEGRKADWEEGRQAGREEYRQGRQAGRQTRKKVHMKHQTVSKSTSRVCILHSNPLHEGSAGHLTNTRVWQQRHMP